MDENTNNLPEYTFEGTADAERALSEAENAVTEPFYQDASVASDVPAPDMPPAPGPVSDQNMQDEPVFSSPQQEPEKKRNYERYLENGPQEAPSSMPQYDFAPGGFEADRGAGTFNSVGNIPTPAPVSNTYNNGYGNNGYTGGGYNNAPASIEGLEEPVSMGEWLICMLLMMVPCVNIVMMFVWAFSKTEKKSKSNFFKIQLIVTGIILALYIVLMIIFVVAGIGIAGALR